MSLLLSFALAGAAALAADKSASPPLLDRAVATAFATCVAAKHPVEAKRYVLHQYGDNWRGSDGDYRKLKDRACVPPQASKETASSLRNITEDQLKMVLAEALVRQDLAQCAQPDQQFSVTRGVLRGFLALYYYRVANSPRIATASAGASK